MSHNYPEPPKEAAVVEEDVVPEVRDQDYDPELDQKDSFSPPSFPNEAASSDEPKDEERPITKKELRDLKYQQD